MLCLCSLHRTLDRLRTVDRRVDLIAQLCIGLRFGQLLRGRWRWPVARGASQRQQQRTRNHRRRSERPRHGGILDWPRRYATPNPKRKAAMDPHRWRLDGQLALVTGGSAGIGLAIARELLGFGARVLIAARNGDSLEDHTTEPQSLMRISYAVFCLKKTTQPKHMPH